MDLAFDIAQAALAVRTGSPRPADLAATRMLLLDTLGAAVAGSSAAGVAEGLAFVRDIAGARQSTLLVFGDRLPATSAALINGLLCQARDFDPVYEPGVLLPYGPVVAASLAAAELAGARGRDLLTAILLGTDLSCRLGRSLTAGLGWSRTATLGGFGAALACAHLLELPRDRIVSALGLALSLSSGNIQTVIDGSLAKRYQGGFAAEAGVKAALLARRGITGPVNVFEGRCGFFNLYEGGRYRREPVLDGLGQHFEGTRASVKPFPCAREQHGAVAAALQLFAAGVRAADVRSVTVHLPPNAFALSGRPFPAAGPYPVALAIGSAAYGVAVALTDGDVGVDDFDEAALSRREVIGLAQRVQVVEDPSITDARTLVPQSVTVQLRDGQTRRATCGVLPGSPDSPLGEERHQAKLAACFAHGAHPLPAGAQDGLQRAVDRLDAGGGLQEVLAATAGRDVPRPAARADRDLDPRTGETT